MEKRLNFNTEVDDLTKINEFFQNPQLQQQALSETQDFNENSITETENAH